VQWLFSNEAKVNSFKRFIFLKVAIW
jgi:hypothetical protein